MISVVLVSLIYAGGSGVDGTPAVEVVKVTGSEKGPDPIELTADTWTSYDVEAFKLSNLADS